MLVGKPIEAVPGLESKLRAAFARTMHGKHQRLSGVNHLGRRLIALVAVK